MYLISIYFDKCTNDKVQSLVNQIASVTGNTFIVDNKIPPHITLLAFDIPCEERAIELFEKNVTDFIKGELFFASVGVFKKRVIYIESVLNEYLHNMSMEIYNKLEGVDGIKFSPYYKPFGWMPHISIGKHLDQNELEKGMSLLIRQFEAFTGNVTHIGLAKTNPHRDIRVVELK